MSDNNDKEHEMRAKSAVAAPIISTINNLLQMLDMEHLKEAGQTFLDQSHRVDSIAPILGPRYDPDKAEELRLCGKALQLLTDYHENNVEITRLRQKMKKRGEQIDDIAKQFGL